MANHLAAAAWVVACLLMAPAALADTLLGVYAGAGTWRPGYTGDVAAAGNDLDLRSDLGMQDRTGKVLYAAVEHAVPVLPDLRLSYAELASRGRQTLTRSVEFSGQGFALSDTVATDVDLHQADAVVYYQVLDAALSLDLGLAARWIEGYVEVASERSVGRAELEQVLPLLYARTRLDLPVRGFWIGAEAMGIAYRGDRLIDASAQAGWESPVGLGAELGWRTFTLDIEGLDAIDAAHVEIRGPYATFTFHF